MPPHADTSKIPRSCSEFSRSGHRPKKAEAVSRWPELANVTQLRVCLGTTGYYHQYVPNYASVAKPLTLLTGEGSAWVWRAPEQSGFDQLKWLLTHTPVLGYPDLTFPYTLDTDASIVGCVVSRPGGTGAGYRLLQ